jgi:hypothetical protein
VLPLDAANASSFLLDNGPIAQSTKVHGEASDRFELPAGTYTFTAILKQPKEVAEAKR